MPYEKHEGEYINVPEEVGYIQEKEVVFLEDCKNMIFNKHQEISLLK